MSISALKSAKPAAKPPRESYTIDSPETSSFTLNAPQGLGAAVVVAGRAKVGKTTLALRYLPEPIAYFNLDGRGDEVVKQMRAEGREIYCSQVGAAVPSLSNIFQWGDKDECMESARRREAQFFVDMDAALRDGGLGNGSTARSVFVDTGSEFEVMARRAIIGSTGKQEDFGRSKGMLNERVVALFQACKAAGVVLVWASRAKQEWRDNKPLDRWLPDYVERVQDAADVVVMLSHDMKESTTPGIPPKVKGWQLEVLEAGANVEEKGAIYKSGGDEWKEHGPLATVLKRQFRESAWEDWK